MNEQPGPPTFGYPAKDQAKAGGRVCRVMSMLVLDKLHYREIGPGNWFLRTGSSAASPAYHVVTPDGRFF